MEKEDVIAGFFILLILLAIGFWFKYQWSLCREAGMAFWYCVQHIL